MLLMNSPNPMCSLKFKIYGLLFLCLLVESVEQSSVEKFEKFTWKIKNFSRLNTNVVSSEPFVIGGYPWMICLYPRGYKVDNYLSIYLKAMQTANMSEGWSRDVKFKLVVFNQLNTNMTITKGSSREFNASVKSWGYRSFLTLDELNDSNKGFLVEDVCIVGVEVFVSKSRNEKRVIQADYLTDMEFAALGRVLYFLKTRKRKDMNEQACKDLQGLWDELEKFQFDLTWLEPSVRSALEMESYVEKALQVKRLKENVLSLELETERRKAELVAAEVTLGLKRDLLKAKGFEESDYLDSELGCAFCGHKPKAKSGMNSEFYL